MAGQQMKIYSAYKERTERNNVEPVETLRGDEVWALFREQGVDFKNPYSHTTRYWDNGPRTKVFKLADGRIAEYAETNTAIGTSLLAIFVTQDDWFNYRRAMGMFHYFNT